MATIDPKINHVFSSTARIDDRRRSPESRETSPSAQDAHVSSRERDFRPAPRRDFDDADYRPPVRNFGYAPPRGPQFDNPSGPPVRATVKWYNPDKGFGFVGLAGGSGDAFLHATVVERSGHGTLPPGATLEVCVAAGPKGAQVTEIVSVDSSTALHRRGRPERRADPAADQSTVEQYGTVKWYNAAKGFGFITPDGGGKDVFVHASALERSDITSLAEGQRVAIDVADGRKGPEAAALRMVELRG